MFKDSKIFIAGHTGLLGSALLKKLKSEGYARLITRTHAELDLTNGKCVNNFFKKENVEYVFLTAGSTGGISANQAYPADFIYTNLAIQNNVFQAAENYSVKHLVFYGSSCMYPKKCLQPMKEEYLLSAEPEETSLAYAVAKISGTVACRAYNQQFNTKRFIALVPNSTYGPNDNFNLEQSHVLAALIVRFHTAKLERRDKVVLWGSGSPRREFIFSEDVADASIFAMKNADRLANHHYNVGVGYDYSIMELANMVSEVVDFKGGIEWDRSKPDGSPQKLLDASKFCALGWKASTSLLEGLKLTYIWYLENYKSIANLSLS